MLGARILAESSISIGLGGGSDTAPPYGGA
jgi:hypothetical protein